MQVNKPQSGTSEGTYMYMLSSSAITGLLRLTMMFVTVVTLGTFAWVGSSYAGQQVFDVAGSDTFTVPAGVDQITVQAWGAGGGGGGDARSDTVGGPGGGGGAYAKTVGLSVTPSTGYAIEVGAAGVGQAKLAGTAGGDSYFIDAATVMAKGGQGGEFSDRNYQGLPGTGGQAGASVGTIRYSGGAGSLNEIQTGGGGGGSAGTASNGNTASGNPGATAVAGGGPGGNGGVANNLGFPPQSGPGGGGGGSGNLKDGAGGRGENGKVVVGWGPQVTTVKKIGQADPTNNLPVSFTVTFSEEVQGFDPVNQPADVNFAGSSATGLSVASIVQETLTSYTVNVNCTGSDGNITIAVPALAVTDNFGNANFASTEGVDNIILYSNSTNPTVTIDKKFSQVNPSNTVPVEFTVVFSEAVNSFGTSDINLIDSSAVGVSVVSVTPVNATTYTVAVTAGGPGTIEAKIDAGVVTSVSASLPNVASTSPVGNSVLFDDERPSVTITGPGATTAFTPIPFSINFSEPVTGFALNDIVLSGGAHNSALLDVTPSAGPATNYTVRVDAPYNGFVTLTVNDSAAVDSAANTSTAQAGGDNSTEYVGGTCYDATVSSINILPAQTVSGAAVDFTSLYTTAGNVDLFNYEINGDAQPSPWNSSFYGLDEGGETVTLKVMGTDPDCGGVPVSATETITVDNFGLSFLVHSSTSTGSSKWGGDWGTKEVGSKYGEIVCETCHSRELAETGANIKRVRTNLPTVGDGSDEEPTENFPGSAETIALTTALNNSSEMGDDSDAHTTSSKICEVCHTYDATGANGVTYHGYDMSTASAFDKIHANKTDCVICHKHSEGFKAAGCNACHGDPPTGSSSMVSLDMDGATSTGALADPAAEPGAHGVHGVTRTMDCETCHKSNTMPVPSKTIEMGFEVNSTNVPGWNTAPAGEVVSGEITVYDSLSNGFSFISTDGGTTVTPEGAQDYNCTVYCHGSWTNSSGTNTPPSWVGGPLGACSTSACHGTDGANPPATGSHVAHAATAGAVKLACNKCHPAYADTSHIDGDVAWALATGDSRIGGTATYAGSDSGTTGSKAPSASFGDCANVYCHGTNTITWGDPAIGCAGCHSASNALAGGHATHYDSGTVVTVNSTDRVYGQNAYMFGCGTCHDTAITNHAAGPAVPGLRSAEISLSYNDDVGEHTNSPDRGFKFTEGTCFVNKCHNDGKAPDPLYKAPNYVARWGGTSLPTDCTGCHNNDATSAASMNSGGHTAHVSAAAVMPLRPCQMCHTNTVDADNRLVPDNKKDMHVNGVRDIAIQSTWDSGGTPIDNWDGTECDNVYCHSNGQDVGTRAYNKVAWGDLLGCDGCHGIAGETTTLTGSHLVHIGSDSSNNNKQFGFTCDVCHVETALDNNNIANINNHLNKSRDVAISVNNGGTGAIGGNFSAEKCATTDCHGSLSEGWTAGASTGDCTTCHDYTGTPSSWRDTSSETLPGDQQVGAHAVHLNGTSGYNIAMDCNECHLTVHNAIDSQTTYVNKVTVAGHNDNNSDAGADISWSNLANKGGLMTPDYDPVAGTCTNVYCHGGESDENGLLGAFDRVPVWSNSQYMDGIAGVFDCSRCHGAPPQGKGHAGTEALTECGNAGCHDDTMNEGSATFKDPSLHVNGTVDNSAVCSTCHPQMPPPQGSHPKHGIHLIQDLGMSDGDPAGQLSDWLPANYETCSICHDMTNPDNHLAVPGTIYMMGPAKSDQRFSDQTPSWPTYDNDPGIQSCTNVKCHFVPTPKWEP